MLPVFVTSIAIIILNGTIYAVGMWLIVFPFHNYFLLYWSPRELLYLIYNVTRLDLLGVSLGEGVMRFCRIAFSPLIISSHQSSFPYICIYGRRIRPSGRVFGWANFFTSYNSLHK